MNSYDHLACFVEDAFIGPALAAILVLVLSLDPPRPVVVVAEPQHAERQQERVLVATGVTQSCTQKLRACCWSDAIDMSIRSTCKLGTF